MSEAYSGVDNLEVMAEAVNYNAFLHDLVARSGAGARRGAVVDFGAGGGLFADHARRSAGHLTCVEPDTGLRQRLAARGHIAVADIAALPDASQDYVYSLNVLEHIEDDAAALRALHRVLKPGGRLFIYTPAFQLLYSAMDRKVGHHRRYTRGQLRRLLEQAGFSVETARYADSLGFFAALLYRFIGNEDGSINRQALTLYDRAVFPLSCALDRLCQRSFGKNVFAVATKP